MERMKRGIWIFLLTVLSLQITAQDLVIDDIVNPKSICPNCYVSNADGILSKQVEQELNQQLDELYRRTTAQVAVVAINGDKNTSARDLSMQLFDKWKVGEKGADNGLIILLCVNARDVFLRTGYGLEGALSDATTTMIFQEKMSPYFKQGNWDLGIMTGVDEVCKIIYEEFDGKGFEKPEPIDYSTYIYTFFVLCIAYTVIAIIMIERKVSQIPSRNKIERINTIKQSSLLWLIGGIILFPSVLLLALWVYVIRIRTIRYAKIKCGCKSLMRRLSEKEEDDYLDTAKQLEEQLGSRDYDVWLCPSCNSTRVFAYDKTFSQYEKCPSCGTKAYRKKYDSVVRPSTTLSEGVMRTVYECEHCRYRGEKLTNIPKKPPVVIVGGIPGGGSGGGFSGGDDF